MDKLFEKRLWNIQDSYIDFVHGMIDYVRFRPERKIRLENYMDKHPTATASDLVVYISHLQDFYDDSTATESSRTRDQALA